VEPEDQIGVARLRLADARRSLSQMSHSTMCAVFVDRAPEDECQCHRRAVLEWLDHIEAPLNPGG
jgi:hypothetical protein